MLALKTARDLNWGELKFIENPMNAIRTIESNNGSGFNCEPIINAKEYNLPDNSTRRMDPYSEIRRKLENGHVFLVNTGTITPLLTELKITDKQATKCTIRQGQTPMFMNAVDAMLRCVPVPHITGVVRQEPAEAKTDKQEVPKKEREKHIILLNLEGQNDRPLPIKHNITLVVENTSQGLFPVRQLKEVIYDSFSRVFTSEKSDQFKIYAITDSMLDVKKDLNENKNLVASESNNRIAALEETGTETRSDGVILHHVKYLVPNNFIEIELLDEDDVPEAGAKFQILNETGKILFNSKLDENGYAIVEGIDVSDATVFFPSVEESAIYDKAQGDKA